MRREVAPFTPEWAAQVTQLPREVIVDEARQLARQRPAVLIHCGRFSAWYGNDTQRARAQAILTALLGAWGRPGGYYLRSNGLELGPQPCPPPHGGKLAPSVASGKHAFTRFGVAAQEIIEASVGPEARIRQWVFHSVNPVQSLPRFARTREALRAVDFITMVDVLPTDGAMWADLILPEAMYLERHDDVLAVMDHPRPFVALRQPVVSPPGEAKEPYWIVQQLAHRMGHKDCFTHSDVTEFLAARLAPLGVSYADLARKGVHLLPEQQPYLKEGEAARFRTPSGKIELFSETLERRGHDGVPRFEAVKQPPLGWFRLVAGRSPYHSFARTENISCLLAKDPRNVLWVNDEVARAKGLRQGEAVYLKNSAGVRAGPIEVLATPAIRTDVVYTVHGFGSQSRGLSNAFARGISDSLLTDDFTVDPPTGATGLRVSLVQLVTQGGAGDQRGDGEEPRRSSPAAGAASSGRRAGKRGGLRAPDLLGGGGAQVQTGAGERGGNKGSKGSKGNEGNEGNKGNKGNKEDVFTFKPEDSC